MALPKNYILSYGQLGTLLEKIQEGQAPEKFTLQHLKDIGMGSSNMRASIPLLKMLGFLTSDGAPTTRYHNYRNKEAAPKVLGEALREAYSDIFVIKAKPTKNDKKSIEGKFRSTHNVTDKVAGLLASTFFALLDKADISSTSPNQDETKANAGNEKADEQIAEEEEITGRVGAKGHAFDFRYNIQIHLPATKDVEVYNAIFKSIRDNLIE